jgi:hypothetical protein
LRLIVVVGGLETLCFVDSNLFPGVRNGYFKVLDSFDGVPRVGAYVYSDKAEVIAGVEESEGTVGFGQVICTRETVRSGVNEGGAREGDWKFVVKTEFEMTLATRVRLCGAATGSRWRRRSVGCSDDGKLGTTRGFPSS